MGRSAWQVGVEPVGDGFAIFDDAVPSVCAALVDDEAGFDSGVGERFDQGLRLLDRDKLVGVTVEDQGGRVVFRDVGDRGDLAADLDDPGFVGDRNIDLLHEVIFVELESRTEVVENAASDGVFPWFAVVEEVGRREEGGDGLDPARRARDQVECLDLAFVAREPLNEREVATGGEAVDSEAFGIDLVIFRVVPDESDRAVEVVDGLGDREPGLAAVDDGEDGVTATDERIDERGADPFVGREPAATDDEDRAEAVGLDLGSEDIESERHAVLAAVDDVFLAREVGTIGRDSRERGERDRQDKGNKAGHRTSSMHV
jgi:hypothetical protein